MFDDVKFAADPYNTGFKLDNIELLMALEIERAGVRHTPVPAAARAA